MKKIVLFILTAAMLLALFIPASADETAGNEYQIGDTTVIFAADSALTAEQQQAIAEMIANPEYGVAKANILCSLFGHKNTTEIITAISHKVKAQDPRCKQEKYEVTTCSRCDEITTQWINTIYISCCPED